MNNTAHVIIDIEQVSLVVSKAIEMYIIFLYTAVCAVVSLFAPTKEAYFHIFYLALKFFVF